MELEATEEGRKLDGMTCLVRFKAQFIRSGVQWFIAEQMNP
jgi:hypothetical protein